MVGDLSWKQKHAYQALSRIKPLLVNLLQQEDRPTSIDHVQFQTYMLLLTLHLSFQNNWITSFPHYMHVSVLSFSTSKERGWVLMRPLGKTNSAISAILLCLLLASCATALHFALLMLPRLTAACRTCETYSDALLRRRESLDLLRWLGPRKRHRRSSLFQRCSYLGNAPSLRTCMTLSPA